MNAAPWIDRIREAIRLRKTNMKAVSKEAGLSETFVRDMLERDYEPKLSNFIAVAHALKLKPGDLLNEAPIAPSANAIAADLEERVAVALSRLRDGRLPPQQLPEILAGIGRDVLALHEIAPPTEESAVPKPRAGRRGALRPSVQSAS